MFAQKLMKENLTRDLRETTLLLNPSGFTFLEKTLNVSERLSS